MVETTKRIDPARSAKKSAARIRRAAAELHAALQAATTSHGLSVQLSIDVGEDTGDSELANVTGVHVGEIRADVAL